MMLPGRRGLEGADAGLLAASFEQLYREALRARTIAA
jgi:hypothetical protein